MALAMANSRITETHAYELAGHLVSTGNDITNVACVRIRKGEEIFEDAAIGSGPIYAAFTAVDKITGVGATLEDFSLNAVTDGEDAMGEAVVKLRFGDELYTGRGLSTDVIESSIRAYINGINKIVASKHSAD